MSIVPTDTLVNPTISNLGDSVLSTLSGAAAAATAATGAVGAAAGAAAAKGKKKVGTAGKTGAGSSGGASGKGDGDGSGIGTGTGKETQPVAPPGGEQTTSVHITLPIPPGHKTTTTTGAATTTTSAATTTSTADPPPTSSPTSPPAQQTTSPNGGGGNGKSPTTTGTAKQTHTAANLGNGNTGTGTPVLVTQTQQTTVVSTLPGGSLTTFTTETPVVTTITSPDTATSPSRSTSTGGIVAGVAIGIIALFGIVFFFFRRSRKQRGLPTLWPATGGGRPVSRIGLVDGDDAAGGRDSASWHRRSVGFTDIWYESRSGTPVQAHGAAGLVTPAQPEMLQVHQAGAMMNHSRESVASAASVSTADFATWIRKSRSELENQQYLNATPHPPHQVVDVESASLSETIESYEGNPANLNPFLSTSERPQSQQGFYRSPFEDPDPEQQYPYPDPSTASLSDHDTLQGEGPLYTVMEETEPPESIRQTIRSSMSSSRSGQSHTQGSLTPRSSIRSSLTRASSAGSHRQRNISITEQARESSEFGYRPPSGSTFTFDPNTPSPTDKDFKTPASAYPKPAPGVIRRHYAPGVFDHPSSPVDGEYRQLGEDWDSTVARTTRSWKTSSILGALSATAPKSARENKY